MLFFHKKPRRPRFASWAFLALVVLFVAIWTQKPQVGLAGLGGVLILASLLVEANKDRIWDEYKKNYKRDKNDPFPASWSKPNPLYYKLNVYVVWPVVFVMGLASIYAAYYIG
jgi:hypothetical protein